MNGVYANMKDSLFWTRKQYLETRLEEASAHYGKVFPELNKTSQLAEYLAKLDPKVRELVLEVDLFASILYDKLGSVPEYLRDSIAIVIMFSMIETLQLATQKYVMLHDWLQSDECARKLDDLTIQGLDAGQRMTALTQVYFSKYGSAHAASEFFENYLSESDKKSLIRTLGIARECIEGMSGDLLRMLVPRFDERMTLQEIKRVLGNRVGEIETAHLPVCYAPVCYIQYGVCWPNSGCRLDHDDDLLRKSLGTVIRELLYAYRNVFVHGSRLPIIFERAESSSETGRVSRIVFDVLNDKFIVHKLDLKFLLEAFRTALKRFFDTARPT
jgi:hypothetical protein